MLGPITTLGMLAAKWLMTKTIPTSSASCNKCGRGITGADYETKCCGVKICSSCASSLRECPKCHRK